MKIAAASNTRTVRINDLNCLKSLGDLTFVCVIVVVYPLRVTKGRCGCRFWQFGANMPLSVVLVEYVKLYTGISLMITRFGPSSYVQNEQCPNFVIDYQHWNSFRPTGRPIYQT
jgi:hypothetical protein